MKKNTIAIGLIVIFALAFTFPALAKNDNENNSQAIGQDPIRLALTQCSNAGIGNGGEWILGLKRNGYVLMYVECLERFYGGPLTQDQIASIKAQTTCEYAYIDNLRAWAFICEVDPGNSADHNANNTK